jgi:hypothetical protein
MLILVLEIMGGSRSAALFHIIGKNRGAVQDSDTALSSDTLLAPAAAGCVRLK